MEAASEIEVGGRGATAGVSAFSKPSGYYTREGRR